MVPVAEGGKLDELRYAAEDLAGWLRCSLFEATEYILTGRIPIVGPIRTGFTRRARKDGRMVVDTVTIVVNYPWVTAEDVSRAYKQTLRKAALEPGSVKTRQHMRSRPAPWGKLLEAFVSKSPEMGWEERR